MDFRIHATDGAARAAVCTLPRASFHTPAFMPVGTRATVKAMGPEDLHAVGAEIILSNAYHLYLRPGADIVESLGGLHGFMGWDKLILTDSGGYQIFSLRGMTKIRDEGVEFRSHVDGSAHFMTPEDNMRLQCALGADIVMALDVCPAADAPRDEVLRALNLTTDWARRCVAQPLRNHQRLFGIVQGGLDKDLRRESAEQIVALDTPGCAIGGLSVGESTKEMIDIAAHTAALLPNNKPRYLMGVGMPTDIVQAVAAGVDMFDCVLPTRMARNGTVFTPTGRLNLRNAACKTDRRPIQVGCNCPACTKFSRAYLRHLFNCNEIMGPRLATFHNLAFYATMMRQIRQAILDGRFSAWKNNFIERYVNGG